MEETTTPAQGARSGRSALLGLLQVFGRGRDASEGPDPLAPAFDRLACGETDDPEPAVARAALALPGVRGTLLLATAPGGGLEPVAAAGLEVPDPAHALPDGNRVGTPPDTSILSVTVPAWGEGPLYRLVALVDRRVSPGTSAGDLARFAAIASPVLGSRPSRRETADLRRRVARLDRRLARLRAKARANRRHALLGRLLDEIASEIANALATVVGCASALRHAPDEGARDAFLSELEGASNRACGIYDQIAALAGCAGPGRAPTFSPGRILDEAMERTARAFERANVSVERRVEPDLPEIEGDPGLAREAFANFLLAFAEEFLAAGARRRFRLEARPTSGSLLVRLTTEGSDPPNPPPSRWPSGVERRVGWWAAREILRDLGASIRSRGWEGGVAETLLVLPVDGDPA